MTFQVVRGTNFLPDTIGINFLPILGRWSTTSKCNHGTLELVSRQVSRKVPPPRPASLSHKTRPNGIHRNELSIRVVDRIARAALLDRSPSLLPAAINVINLITVAESE